MQCCVVSKQDQLLACLVQKLAIRVLSCFSHSLFEVFQGAGVFSTLKFLLPTFLSLRDVSPKIERKSGLKNK